MSNEPFVIERTYNAPIERVWKAITSKEAMDQWYFETSGFEPKVGCEFTFIGKDHDGIEYLHRCKILEVTAPNLLKHTWTYDGHEGVTTITFELSAEGDKTRLKLTHEGIENLPNLPAFAKENFAQGWTEIIGKLLPEYVEESSLSKSIEIEAAPEQIWEVITTPTRVRQWAKAFMEGTYAESDFQQGSIITWYTGDGEVAAKGIVTLKDKPSILELSYFDDPTQAAPASLDKYQEIFKLKTNGNKTVLTIEAGPLAVKYTNMHDPMWQKALELIKEVVEAK